MGKQNNNASAGMGYPWYDDRVELLTEEGSTSGWPYNTSGQKADYDDPKKLYEYLNRYVWKQEEAKRAASIIAYNCFERGIKSNNMFVGPTGCGKTYVWQCLKGIFPDRIEIVDGSNITLDGWNGGKKWSSLFRSPIFRSGEKTILVIDEADKMMAPKYASGGENVSHSVQSEGLKLMEGISVEVKENSITYQIDTSNISFVLCGAFSVKAADMAEKENGSRIGFGAAPGEAKAYDRHLGTADIIEYGVMPEFMGRIQRIVHLEPMTVDDYYRMIDSSCGPLQRIEQQYKADVRLTARMRHELAETAYNSGLGIRGMENQIRAMLDDALFEDCDRRCFEF